MSMRLRNKEQGTCATMGAPASAGDPCNPEVFMNDAAREALSAILFADTSTPLDVLVRQCRDNPVHLKGHEAEAIAGSQGALTLWREKEGCALLAADLHSLVRDVGLPDTGLVLHLPATIDGVPLVRIAGEAFRPWLSYGVGVRLLVLPEGMRETSDGALSPLCFEHAALPSTLERFGKRPVQWSKLTRYPESVRYLVHPDNPALFSEDGSLYSRDGETLIAQAYPYGECVKVRDGVRVIRPDAFLHTPHPPQRIVCPDSLKEARDDIDGSLLWIRSPETAFARTLDEAGRRAVSPAFRIIDDDVFDFDDEGNAMLVMSSHENAAVAPPDDIAGAPLTRIGRRALPLRAKSAAIPACVTDVGDGNVCEGAERIVVGEQVKNIGRGCFMHAAETCVTRIPRSVRAIGERSFSGGWVRFDALDTVVYIPAGVRGLFEPRAYRIGKTGIELVGEGVVDAACFTAPFDMEAYDELLAGDRAFLTKTQALVERLAGKTAVGKDAAAAFARQLEKNAEATCALIAERRSRRAVERLADTGFYDDERRFLLQCEQLRKARAAEALGCLMRRREAASLAKPSDRFAF